MRKRIDHDADPVAADRGLGFASSTILNSVSPLAETIRTFESVDSELLHRTPRIRSPHSITFLSGAFE